jgi:hypothetical protein
MPRTLSAHTLADKDGADQNGAHVQLNVNTEQTLVLDPDCSALILNVRGTAPAVTNVTFNNTAASTTNGITIAAGAQPVYIPLGYSAHGAHTLRAQGTAQFLDVLQLA